LEILGLLFLNITYYSFQLSYTLLSYMLLPFMSWEDSLGCVIILHVKDPVCWFEIKKFWDELIIYFPLIWPGLNRKWHVKQFFSCCMCICCCCNIFTEPSPSNNRRVQTDGRDFWSMQLTWAQVPWYTVKLLEEGIHRHTDSGVISYAYFNFSKWGK
jgi:hypothetical protein